MNAGGLTTKVEGMMRLVKDVKSPWFGVNLNTGNFRGYIVLEYEEAEDLASAWAYARMHRDKIEQQIAENQTA